MTGNCYWYKLAGSMYWYLERGIIDSGMYYSKLLNHVQLPTLM